MNRSCPRHADQRLIRKEICRQVVSIQYGENYNRIILRNSKLNSKLNQGMMSKGNNTEPSSSPVKKKKVNYQQRKSGKQRQEFVKMQNMHRKLCYQSIKFKGKGDRVRMESR